MEALLARYPGRSKTAAVEAAISDHVGRHAADELRRLAGTMEIEDVSAELRALDRRAMERLLAES